MTINKPRIGILVVAYNAVTTLAKVFDRIPSEVMEEVEEIVVFDDASHDDTYVLAHGYKLLNELSKLHIFKNTNNIGYGGNQKLGYNYFINKGFDAVVLLHGDGQYAPELLKNMYQPIVDNKADAVFGSRMMKEFGGPLKGGMPFYKYIGNKILTSFENNLLDMNLTEFHSGYRAYNCHALKNINFQSCADDFHFDTEIIVKLNHMKYSIMEVPIPTYYGSEICYVNGMKYAFNVATSVINYKLSVIGFKNISTYSEFFNTYPLREHSYSSHNLIANYVGRDKVILDLGCGPGHLSNRLKSANKFICGVDIEDNKLNQDNFDEFIQADLEKNNRFEGLDISKFDVILCADIIEHLRNPADLLREIRRSIRPDAKVILSVPNVANIAVRIALLLGKFPYADSGILDRNHIKFFTLNSIRDLIITNGYEIIYTKGTPVPVALFLHKSSGKIWFKILEYLFFKSTNLFKKLLSYQFVFVIVPKKNASF